MDRLAAACQEQLTRIRSQGRWRHVDYTYADASLLDLTHNDYLALGSDQGFQEAVRSQIGDRPLGSGASRLLARDLRDMNQLEAEFAAFKGAATAIYYPTGFTANEAVLAALALKKTRLIRDQWSHASTVNGVRQSAIPKTLKRIFPHNDLLALEQILAESKGYTNLIATEALFSMNGDRAPLKELKALADKHAGVLIIDEAHSLGVYGKRGQGCVDDSGIDPNEVITVNPCGKAFAAQGAFVTGPAWLRPFLINTSRPLIFSTAPSPWLVAALRAVIPKVVASDVARQHLAAISARIRSSFVSFGLSLCGSDSHIVPIMIGSEGRVIAATDYVRERGLLVAAIRPPTVPADTCRIRLALHAGLTEEDLLRIEAAFCGLRAHMEEFA